VEEPLHSNQAADGRFASASLSGSFAAVIPCWPPARLVARIYRIQTAPAAGVFYFFLLYFLDSSETELIAVIRVPSGNRLNFCWNLPILILSVRTL